MAALWRVDDGRMDWRRCWVEGAARTDALRIAISRSTSATAGNGQPLAGWGVPSQTASIHLLSALRRAILPSQPDNAFRFLPSAIARSAGGSAACETPRPLRAPRKPSEGYGVVRGSRNKAAPADRTSVDGHTRNQQANNYYTTRIAAAREEELSRWDAGRIHVTQSRAQCRAHPMAPAPRQ